MIEKALEIAKQSRYHVKVGCVITDKRGRVIASGFNNHLKTHPMQAKYAYDVGEPFKLGLHAEISALVKCRQDPHTLYVARQLNSGDYGLAKPCPICHAAIKEAGIKRVVYTTNGKEIGIYEL